MREQEFRGLESAIRKIDLHAHIANEKKAAIVAGEGEQPKKPYGMSGDVALIDLIGPMTKYGSSLTGGGTVQTRRAVRQAAADPEVGGILLRIHSPGGSVSGTGDLANDVRAAAANKPIMAYAEDLVASAAYWVASQASAIHASANAEIGSIGTYAVVEDWSKVYDEAGVKVHVVKAGAFKAAGIEGTPITDDQLAEMQREVDAINALFVQGVASGRKLELNRAAELADGRVHIASEAKRLGLIDELGTIDAAMSALRNMIAARAARRPNMSDNVIPADAGNMNTANVSAAHKAASINELKAVNADAGFVLACVEAGLTLDQAKAMNTTQTAAAESAKKLADENAALKLRVEKLEKCGGAYSSDPGDENDAKPTNKADAARFAEWKQNETALRKMGYKSFEEYAEIESKVDESLRVSRN